MAVITRSMTDDIAGDWSRADMRWHVLPTVTVQFAQHLLELGSEFDANIVATIEHVEDVLDNATIARGELWAITADDLDALLEDTITIIDYLNADVLAEGWNFGTDEGDPSCIGVYPYDVEE